MKPTFSVVIPTHNRRQRLERTLASLEAQRACPDFEIIVVDDGSRDGTSERLARRSWTRPHERLRLPCSAGPAAARNAGVEAARGECVAFLGDDTQPMPDWLAAHANAHQAGACAVIGTIRWAQTFRPTRFTRYIAEQGPQFGFALIGNPLDVHFRFFYASNLSLRREYLLREPFDESFRTAAWEDIELGYRLQQRGLRFVYESRAIVEHDHPTDLNQFLARQFRVGEAAPNLVRLHPELGWLAQFGESGPSKPAPRWLVAGARGWARALENVPISLRPLWSFLCRESVRAGLEHAWRGHEANGRPERRNHDG